MLIKPVVPKSRFLVTRIPLVGAFSTLITLSARLLIALEPEIESFVNIASARSLRGCARVPVCFHTAQTLSTPYVLGVWRFATTNFT